ncbi:MAG: tRNA (adenosine(37)-N6)-threonylcarbamoyltransferase complex ATPase subunit type 1 TsaE [Candidatus Vogelbacteria bacterium]|nr:tRNA (adenosine(37)-N6)-threonylcarbamoyltransferase complex ATPase subunit type 1 TsaE [Candidatus Vogelbacteria bacterium]
MEIVSRSLAETEEAARAFLDKLKPAKGRATVIGLLGELGSGKTAFTQAAARALGIRAPVQSPTFVIMKTYAVSGKWQGSPLTNGKGDPFCPWGNLIHIDCYRLNKADDLLHLGWDELAADPANLILVEWPERVGNLLSSPALKIKFEVVDENSRKIIYDEK